MLTADALHHAFQASTYSVAMSAEGRAAKCQTTIDPRNHGVKNFPALFVTSGLFNIATGENGHSHVADRRNEAEVAARPLAPAIEPVDKRFKRRRRARSDVNMPAAPATSTRLRRRISMP